MSLPIWFNRNDPVPDKHEAFVKDLLTKQRQHLGDAGAWEWLKQTALAFTEGDRNDAETLARYIVQDVYNIGGDPAPIPVPVPAGYPTRHDQLVGVSYDYTWTLRVMPDFMARLAARRLTATSIEYMGGWDRNGSANGWKHGADSLREPYLELLDACRRHKIALIVSVLNDNKGLGKYGDDKKPMSDYKKQAERALQIVLDAGPEAQWVQVCSETQTAYGKELEARWLPKFQAAGFRTIWNRGSRPAKAEMGCDTFAWHNCKLDDLGKAGGITLPDCGTAISAYTNGGIYGASLKADVVGKHVAAVRKAGNRGSVIYTFTGMVSITDDVLDAIAKAWGASSQPSPVPTTGPRIVSLKASSREFYIDFVLAGVDHWKNNADRLSAEIIINGVYVENIREGYTSQHLKNVYGTGSHAVRGLKTGQPCEIYFRKKGGTERTNAVQFVWPWKPT